MFYRQLFRDRRIRAYANTDWEKCVYARMPRDGRDEHKSRGASYAAYGSDASRGTTIDGCLLQLTCKRRAARTLRASRWRAVVECTRPTHRSPTTSHHLRARRRERYYPVMDAPSVSHRKYLARRDETPMSTLSPTTSQRRNSMRSSVHAARRRLSRRIHPSRNDGTTSIDPLGKAST